MNYDFLSDHIAKEDDKSKEEKENSEKFLDFNKTEIAMDNSGSTSGSILKKSKELIKSIVFDSPDRDKYIQRILAWNSDCQIKSLDSIESTGGTYPSTIFGQLSSSTQNILMTTDGEIFKEDLPATRKKLQEHLNIKNVFAIVVMSEESPSKINFSVFGPFMEHCAKMGGCFYLFCRKTDEDLQNKLYILLKRVPANLKYLDTLPETLSEYTPKVKWSDVPSIKFSDIATLCVPKEYNGFKEGQVVLSDKKVVNLLKLEEDLNNKSEKNKEESKKLFASLGYNNFIVNEIPEIIDQAVQNRDSKALSAIRSIVTYWKIGQIEEIEKEMEQLRNEAKITEYEELSLRKVSIKDKNSQEFKEISKRLAELSDDIFPKINKLEILKREKLAPILQKHGELMQILSESQNSLLKELNPEDYNLGQVTKKISNRAKRAEVKQAPTEEANWDLTGDFCVCKECLICARENLPCAILLLDIQTEYPKLLENNLLDYALNDEIACGMTNVCAIPSGEFCVTCAYSLLGIGKHPITRQKIASVLVLCDPTKGKNKSLIIKSLCASVFGGKQIAASYQMLLGMFEQLKKNEEIESETSTSASEQNRFSKEVYDWVFNLALNYGSGNLLPEDVGKTKKLLLAMYDVLYYKFIKTNAETWLIPMRNKSFSSESLICRCLMNNVEELKKNQININLDECMEKSINLMRRIFIKICCSRLTILGKKRADAHEDKDKIQKYDIICLNIENDLFDNSITTIPVFNSEKIVKLENSHMLKALFGAGVNSVIQEVKYFENFIKKLYEVNKDNEKFAKFKDFELMPKNLMTLLTLGIYKITSQEASHNLLCVKEEDLLKKYLAKNRMNIPKDEKEISDVFFEGNFGHLKSYSEPELINCIHAIAPYLKISGEMPVDHNKIIQFASHLFGPPVTICSICKTEFISHGEKEKMKNSQTDPKELNDIVNKVKSRRNEHFNKIYKTNLDFFSTGENCLIFSSFEIVRKVCNTPENKNLERPTRKLLEEELAYAKKKSPARRGNIYKPNLLEALLKITWDFLQKRKGKNFDPEIYMLFKKRVIYEAEHGYDDLYLDKEATLEGLTEEEIKDLLKPFDV